MVMANRAEIERQIEKQAAIRKAEWLQNNGFNSEGVTYIYYPDNSYDIRADLKADCFRFTKELLWHRPELSAAYPECIKVHFEEIGEFTAWGQGLFYPEVKQIINKKLCEARPVIEYDGEWLGSEGERLRDIIGTVVQYKEICTQYGYTNLIEIETDDHDILQWWTSTYPEIEIGDKVTFAGTVKRHSEFKGKKSTSCTRCKIEVI